MIIIFLKYSWECDNPSKAATSVSHTGLVQDLEWSIRINAEFPAELTSGRH